MPPLREDSLLGEISRKLDLIIRILLIEGVHIMADLSAIQAAVANETTVEQSAVVLLGQLADELRAAGNDPVAVAALADQIQTNADTLAAAVAANTPAAPAP